MVGFHSIQLDKGMRRGLLKIMVISYIAHHNTYPYAMLKTMKAHAGMHGHAFAEVTKNDVYNIVSSLERDGFIKSRMRTKGGKMQKIVALTQKGKEIMKGKNRIVSDTIRELTGLAEGAGFNV
ncbi:MAG: PadR family transcriptional regulator [Candidatus Marsarchaeota archaeon]|nr:PadR family transcriptional regulator [Candidatus Marsarchaeota archaeon]MCL5413062.1 PadR family transcriptional regulator [Candidatus Marsarchaeota archaeon]